MLGSAWIGRMSGAYILENIQLAPRGNALITAPQRSTGPANSGFDTFDAMIGAFPKMETAKAEKHEGDNANTLWLGLSPPEAKSEMPPSEYQKNTENGFSEPLINNSKKLAILEEKLIKSLALKDPHEAWRDSYRSSSKRKDEGDLMLWEPTAPPPAKESGPAQRQHIPAADSINGTLATQVILNGVRETAMLDPAYGPVHKDMTVDDRLPRKSSPAYPALDRETQLPGQEWSVADRAGAILPNPDFLRHIGHEAPPIPPIVSSALSSSRQGPEGGSQPLERQSAQDDVGNSGDFSKATLTPDNPAWISSISNTGMGAEPFVTAGPRQTLADLSRPPPATAGHILPEQKQADLSATDRPALLRRDAKSENHALETSDKPSSGLIRHTTPDRESSPARGTTRGLVGQADVAAMAVLPLAASRLSPGITEDRPQGLQPRTSPIPDGRHDTNQDRTGTGQATMRDAARFFMQADARPKVAPPRAPTIASEGNAPSDGPAPLFPAPTPVPAAKAERAPRIDPSVTTTIADHERNPSVSDDRWGVVVNKAIPIIAGSNAIPDTGTDSASAPPGNDILSAVPDFHNMDATEHRGHPRSSASAARTASPETVSTPSPIPQLAQAISALHQAADGSRVMTLNLRPESLGQVQVRIIRSTADGDQIAITVARPETLALLRADTTALHQALDAAGIAPTQRDIALQLATPAAMSTDRGMSAFDHPSSGDGSQRSFTSQGGHAMAGTGGNVDSSTDSPAPPAPRAPRRSTGLDITA